MKRTLLSMALFSAMVVMSSGASAVEVTTDTSLDRFEDAGNGLLIGPEATFKGQSGNLSVTGILSGGTANTFVVNGGEKYAGIENQGTLININSITADSFVNFGSKANAVINGNITVTPATGNDINIAVRNLDGATLTLNGKNAVITGQVVNENNSQLFINQDTTINESLWNTNGSTVTIADGVTVVTSTGFSNGGIGFSAGTIFAANATIKVGGESSIYEFANYGTAEVGSLTGGYVRNNGELTVHNEIKSRLNNAGGILTYNGGASITSATVTGGAFYVSSGHLTVDEDVEIMGQGAIQKNSTENLQSLKAEIVNVGVLPFGSSDLPSLVVDGSIEALGLSNEGIVKADTVSVSGLYAVYNKQNTPSLIDVRALTLTGSEYPSTIGEGGAGPTSYGDAYVVVHEMISLNEGHVLENYGGLLLDGETVVIDGDGTIENKSKVWKEPGASPNLTTTGMIAKDSEGTKIDSLIINSTLNNEGEVYAKNLSVKNGYDGTNDADSAAFDVDNLTVMEAGEFALNSTSTDLQTVTISKDATLTANKTVNLSGAASVSNNGGTATFGEVNSENLNVYGTSGQTTIAKARMSNQVGVTLDSGTVTIDDLETQKLDVTINNLEGNKLDVVKVNDDVNASVTVSSQANTGAAQDVIDKVIGSVAIGTDNATDVDYLITAKPGLITDGFTTQSNDPTTIHTTKNPTMDAFGSVTALSALTIRHEMNSLSKRMGELRDAPAGVGVWARAYGSEMEYGAQDVKAKNNSVQMGADYTLGDWKVGAAFSYTDGESSYESGKADNKNYGLALYGTWFVPCGAYVDLIAKYTHMDNDFTMGGLDGSFENDAFNVSAETGYRFNFMDGGVYVEPQVGLSYGYVKGESFAAGQGVTIEQDDYDSFIGRVGVRTGFKFPKDKGTIYARVSGVYDFNGEVNARAYNASASNTIESDMGGAWLEMGVGANFNWTKNTYTYIDFERTNGGDVKENYRWNVGVRHTF